MEPKYKSSIDVVFENGREKELAAAANYNIMRKIRVWDLFLRLAAVVLSLTAAVVLGVNKETTTVAVKIFPDLPAVLNVPVTAKWHYLSAFVYFMVVNVIACVYGAISLLIILTKREANKTIAMMIVVCDLVMVVLLFSSLGASLAAGLISYAGNRHTHWHKVCDVIGKFCRQGSVSLGLSVAASSVFFLLLFGAILSLHKKKY